ncbi:MAG: hypothetical protein GF331_14420 [Chitinivibrionales bacterium]|nr:hypothetical protein [Chitinivibrionales bacterium]
MHKVSALIAMILLIAQMTHPQDDRSAGRQQHEDYTVLFEIAGIPSYSAELVSPIQCNVNVDEYQDGGALTILKHPATNECEDVVIRFNEPYLPELWDWFTHVRDMAAHDFRSILLRFYDDDGNELFCWVLLRSWPRSWRTVGHKIEGGDVEEIAHEITFVVEGAVYGRLSQPAPTERTDPGAARTPRQGSRR